MKNTTFLNPHAKTHAGKGAYYLLLLLCIKLNNEKKIVMTIDTDFDEVLDELGAVEFAKRVNAMTWGEVAHAFDVARTRAVSESAFNAGKKLILDTIDAWRITNKKYLCILRMMEKKADEFGKEYRAVRVLASDNLAKIRAEVKKYNWRADGGLECGVVWTDGGDLASHIVWKSYVGKVRPVLRRAFRNRQEYLASKLKPCGRFLAPNNDAESWEVRAHAQNLLAAGLAHVENI